MPAGPLDPALRVDWLPSELLADGRPGRLGLTIMPGKHGPSVRYPGHIYRRELEADLTALRQAGVRRLVLLVEDHELERWGDPAIRERAAGHGLNVVRAPIADGRAPRDATVMDGILVQIDAGRAAGNVAVACMGGVGRSGMVAACALVRTGMEPREAIDAVRAARHPDAVETAEQQRFVTAYAARRAAAGGSAGQGETRAASST